MAPTESPNQTLNTNSPEQENQHKSWWPLWLLGGLILLFLIMVIILRGLCTDVWYINLLKLNDNLCNGSSVTNSAGTNIRPGLALEGNSLTIEGGNTVVLPVKEGPEGKEGKEGPAGSKGTTGAKGATGSTGATGPAGPTDPCVTSGTYFCQNGNSYGTLAVLGTNDAQDLQVETAGTRTATFDVNGNLMMNRIGDISFGGLLDNSYDILSQSNIISANCVFGCAGPTTYTSSSANIGWSGGGVVDGSSYNLGTLGNTSNLNLSIGLFNGVTDGYGLIGRASNVSNSNDLLGAFANVTNSDRLLGYNDLSIGANNTIDNSSSSFIAQGTGGNNSATDIGNSILYASFNNIASNVQQSILMTANDGTFDTIQYSYANGYTNDITNLNFGVVSGAGNTVTDVSNSVYFGNNSPLSLSDRSLVFLDGSIGLNIDKSVVNADLASSISNVGNSFIAGTLIDFDNVNVSSVTGFNSAADNLAGFYGNLSSSSVSGLQGGSAFLNRSDINNVFGLYGFTGWAAMNNTNYAAGKFEGVDVADSNTLIGQFGYYTCDPVLGCSLPNIFEIHNSSGIVGEAIYTNIYDSTGLALNTSSTDPIVFTTTITNTNTSSISGIDLSITDTSYSQLLGNTNDITGLDHSILVGDGVTIADPGVGSYDYSFIGANSTGAINTRINHKGDDSWLNLGGGNVGIGTNTPANKLDVTNAADDTPASFTGTSGTCTVDTFGGGWSCVSDQKLKTNILSINNGLEAVLALQGVTYNWKASPDGQAVSGFIAQEVEKVLPGLVTELQDGTKSLNKDGMLPYIIEAIKTQDSKLEGVNTKLATQGLKIDSLTEDLRALAARVDLNTSDIEKLKQENINFKVKLDSLEARLQKLEQTP